jgi:uncharacterized membrane protein
MRLRIAIAAVAGLGAAVTGYLTVVHYTGARLVCPTSGCETVQHSRYAELVGIPVALLGLLGFVAIFATALVRGEEAAQIGAGIALVAFLFSGYLLLVQLFAIHAICTWCVTSDALTTLLLPLTWLRVRSSARDEAPAARSGRGSRAVPRPSR